jgi:hypothetical protein
MDRLSKELPLITSRIRKEGKCQLSDGFVAYINDAEPGKRSIIVVDHPRCRGSTIIIPLGLRYTSVSIILKRIEDLEITMIFIKKYLPVYRIFADCQPLPLYFDVPPILIDHLSHKDLYITRLLIMQNSNCVKFEISISKFIFNLTLVNIQIVYFDKAKFSFVLYGNLLNLMGDYYKSIAYTREDRAFVNIEYELEFLKFQFDLYQLLVRINFEFARML